MSKAKNVEIERKFLVNGDNYKKLAIKHFEIVQGYLCKGEGKTVRVRIRDNQAFLTIKGGAQSTDRGVDRTQNTGHRTQNAALKVESIKTSALTEHRTQNTEQSVLNTGLARFEWEKEISVEDAKELLQLAQPELIEKTRWIVPAGVQNTDRCADRTQDTDRCADSTQSTDRGADRTQNTDGEKKLVWEVDEFHGRLEGRTLAEIELDYESQEFEKPAFIGEEVTGKPEYYNANM